MNAEIHRFHAPQKQVTGGKIRCSIFIRSKRSRRRSKQAAQFENFCRSHKSAKTRPRLSRRQASKLRSNVKRLGGENRPVSARASSDPFPNRVGMSETTAAPCSNAKRADAADQCTASASGTNGG